jgi:hypothetical protein
LPRIDSPLVFGIYPGGQAGSDQGVATGRPDDPERVLAALRSLQGGTAPFVVRAYDRYSDATAPSRYPRHSPERYESLAGEGRRLDLVLLFQSTAGDVPGFLEFVRAAVRRLAPLLYTVQVTEEANFTTGPDAIDGPYPRVLEALTQGVVTAREELARLGAEARVGFSVTPTFGDAADFWPTIGRMGGVAFREALGYVALDFFPDLFVPAAPDGEPGDLRSGTLALLRTMREEWLPSAGVRPDVPIHVGEHGWPTGEGRPCERQARVFERVVRAVHEVRAVLNVERYTAFALRDANSASRGGGDFWHQFGLLRDDYEPKPAFDVLRRLVAELGAR